MLKTYNSAIGDLLYYKSKIVEEGLFRFVLSRKDLLKWCNCWSKIVEDDVFSFVLSKVKTCFGDGTGTSVLKELNVSYISKNMREYYQSLLVTKFRGQSEERIYKIYEV